MPRSIWGGAISFGLVSVPVKLYTATSPKDVRFNQLHAKDHGRIQMKRFCAKEGEEVPYKEIVKGYEIQPDQYVVISPEELEALDPDASRTIDISDFVPEDQLDPVMYENSYYLVPEEVGKKAYGLLLAALRDSGRVAIATMVVRNKQYLAVIRPTERALVLTTMLFADEVVSPDAIDGLPQAAPQPSDKERAMAQQLIDAMAGDFEPEKYRDEYRQRVVELIERKAQGEVVSVEAPAAKKGEVVDLAAALEETLKLVREKRAQAEAKAKGGKATGKPAATAEAAEEEAAEAGPSKAKKGGKAKAEAKPKRGAR